MTYLEYRHRVELDEDRVRRDRLATAARGASPGSRRAGTSRRSTSSSEFDPVALQDRLGRLTDDALLSTRRRQGRPVILSTGMSTLDEIDAAVALFATSAPAARHTHQHLPVPAGRAQPAHDPHPARARIRRARSGYSGHEVGPADHGRRGRARRLPRRAPHHARPRDVGHRPGRVGRARGPAAPGARHPAVEAAVGDGVKRVYDSELPMRAKLRRVQN